MSSRLPCLSRSSWLVWIILCLNWLICLHQFMSNSYSRPLLNHLFSACACSWAPRWMLDLSSVSFIPWSSLLQSTSLLSATSTTFWYSDSMDFAFSAHWIGLVFDLPSAPRSTLFCSVACSSPIFVLSAPKRCLGVASLGNQQYLPQCWSFGLRASSLLRVPRYDGTAPHCVSSSHDRLDFWWGVLRSVSCNRWSALDGRFVV